MKLKTLHLFSQNQFCKIILLTSLIVFSDKACTQENNASSIPGIIESFERLLDLHKDQYQKTKNQLQANLKVVNDLSNLKDVKLHPQYVKSLIMHSDERFLKLGEESECKFLSVIETNLLKTVEGNIDNILLTYKNKDNQIESAIMPKNDFFDQIYKKKCLNNREYTILFTDTNLPKTVEGIKFSIPKSKNECLNIHKEWIANSFTPYLCRVQQSIKKFPNSKQSEFYKEKIPLMQRVYLDNLCNSILTPDLFCEGYLKSDVWNRVLNSEAPDYKMSYKCQNMYNKTTKLNPQELKNCAAKLINDSSFCETRGNKNFYSNFPLQNCNNISIALNKSKLITDYQDCPGSIDNEALTNIHRIINHFDPRKIITSKEACSGETHYSYAKLNFDIKYETGWPLKVCYLNRIENKENCTTYIPGSREGEPLSEDQVVAKILTLQKGAPQKTTCRIVDAKTYNPLRSEFKFGCFIVFDTESCTTISCDKKVIWDERVQEDIKFIGKPVFDYFPTAFLNERYAFTNLLSETRGTQERIIRNITDVKFFLDKIPNGIIHGMGCIEDILPEQFQRISINQCHPTPFIIDGHAEKNNETLMVTRLAIDDLHTPRLILWSNFFNAVSAYQEIHPLNTWTLYGIKK